jgi:hypothetical protein
LGSGRRSGCGWVEPGSEPGLEPIIEPGAAPAGAPKLNLGAARWAGVGVMPVTLPHALPISAVKGAIRGNGWGSGRVNALLPIM